MKLCIIVLAMLALPAQAQRFQCANDANRNSVRSVQLADDALTVVNPATPRVGGPQPAKIERRGDITRAESEAWLFFHRAGIGTLENRVFGDKYTCIKLG